MTYYHSIFVANRIMSVVCVCVCVRITLGATPPATQCLTCTLNEDRCQYNSAYFSHDASFFRMDCSGPSATQHTSTHTHTHYTTHYPNSVCAVKSSQYCSCDIPKQNPSRYIYFKMIFSVVVVLLDHLFGHTLY